MIPRFLIIAVLHLLVSASVKANFKLRFIPLYKTGILQLDAAYSNGSDTLCFSDFKLYLSHVKLYRQSSSINGKDSGKIYLLDWSRPETCIVELFPDKEADSISFAIGIDSLSSCSGVFTGDLDPMKGMYWAWQSGFINWKLEGYCSTLPSRHHRFQWHIGGYMQPNYCLQFTGFKLSSPGGARLSIDLDMLLQKAILTAHYEIMSPSPAAVRVAQLLAALISIEDGVKK